uniref:Flavodoxin-like domain-containing protein n=1 Tax=Ascaris lumbricoides TaxID=6252 RepID=A0A0M3IG60_ASCLU
MEDHLRRWAATLGLRHLRDAPESQLVEDRRAIVVLSSRGASGRELMMASTSMHRVASSASERSFLPIAGRRADFVRPMRRSYSPPFQGAWDVLNVHSM